MESNIGPGTSYADLGILDKSDGADRTGLVPCFFLKLSSQSALRLCNEVLGICQYD